MDTWAPHRGITTVKHVFDHILPWLKRGDGVTISGGEPFDQPQALAKLLSHIRGVHSGDILVYSGHSLEVLSQTLQAFEGLIDLLIADPLQLEAPQTLALRGSDNQRLIPLTPLGRDRLPLYNRCDRILDIMFDDVAGEVWFAGIPRRGDFRRLASLLGESGHEVITTEDTRAQ